MIYDDLCGGGCQSPSRFHPARVPVPICSARLCGLGVAGAFRFFRRFLGVKRGWMLGWVFAGGGLRLKYNLGVI